MYLKALLEGDMWESQIIYLGESRNIEIKVQKADKFSAISIYFIQRISQIIKVPESGKYF